MVKAGVEDISARHGLNRIGAEVLDRDPGEVDIPSETEIRNAITAMLVQVKTGQTEYFLVAVKGYLSCNLGV